MTIIVCAAPNGNSQRGFFVETKRCCTCKQVLPISEFYKCSRDGHQPHCKKCKRERERERAIRIKNNRDTPPETQVCSRCGIEKLASEFHKGATKASGLSGWCKQCEHEWRQYKLETRPEFKATFMEQSNEWHRKKYQADKEWRAKKRTYISNWQQENRKLVRLYSRITQSNRRQRIRNNGGTHTVDDIQQILEQQAHRCYWCLKPLGESWHIDHRIPIAKGGTNNPNNLVISCPFCNTSKGSKLPYEWCGRLL